MRLTTSSFLLVFSIAFTSMNAAAAPLPWRTGGPHGGVVYAVSVAPSNPQRFYAATGDGLFTSVDAGTTWERAGGPAVPVFHVAVDPGDESTVYLTAGALLYKSVDGGRSWAPLPLPAGTSVSSLVIDPRDGETIYVGSRCGPIFKMRAPSWHEAAGVYKSTDGGLTWHKGEGLTGFQQCVEQLAQDPVSPDTLYATPIYLDGGYARSDDGGETWRTAAGRVPGGGVVVNPLNPSFRYGITHSSNSHFLVSEDSGASWVEIEPRLLGDGRLPAFVYNDLSVDPQTGRIFLASDTGIYRSGDGGRTWLAMEGAGRDAVRSLHLEPVTGRLTIGTINAVFRSPGFPWNDWRTLPVDYLATSILEIEPDPSDSGTLFARSGNRIYRTTNLGRHWEPVGEVIPTRGTQPFRSSDLAVGAGGNLYVVGFSGEGDQLLRLDRTTGEWRELSLPPALFGGNTMKFVTADPRVSGEIYVGQAREIAHSLDAGETWEQFVLPDSYPAALAIDPKNTDVLYAATQAAILKSSDRGRTWSIKKVVDQSGEFNKDKIVISPADPSTVYAFSRFFGPITRSRDGGETWDVVLLPAELNDLAADVHDPDTLYAATLDQGVFRSSDRGATWQSIGEGLPEEEQIRSIAVDRAGRFVHAGTWSSGVWELQLSSRRRPVRGH